MKKNVSSFKNWLTENYTEEILENLPDPVILKRVVMLKDVEDFDKEEPGQHWVLKRDIGVLDGHRAKEGKKTAYLITAKVPKDLINFEETIRIRKEFPMEREIALKNKGRGAEILSIEPFTPKGESDPYVITSPAEFDLDFDFAA